MGINRPSSLGDGKRSCYLHVSRYESGVAANLMTAILHRMLRSITYILVDHEERDCAKDELHDTLVSWGTLHKNVFCALTSQLCLVGFVRKRYKG